MPEPTWWWGATPIGCRAEAGSARRSSTTGWGTSSSRRTAPEGARTGVFTVTITGRRVDGYQWIPGRISGSVPAPLEGDAAANELAYWKGLQACAGLQDL